MSDDEFEHDDVEEHVTTNFLAANAHGLHSSSPPHGLRQGMSGSRLTMDTRNMAYTRYNNVNFSAIETSPPLHRMLDSAAWLDRNVFLEPNSRPLVNDRGLDLYRQSPTGEFEMRERPLEPLAGIRERRIGQFVDRRYPRTGAAAMEQRMVWRATDLESLRHLVQRQSELVNCLRQEKSRRVRQKLDTAQKKRKVHQSEDDQQDYSTSLFQDGSAARFPSTSPVDLPNLRRHLHQTDYHLTSGWTRLGHGEVEWHQGPSSAFAREEIPQGSDRQTDRIETIPKSNLKDDSRPGLRTEQPLPLLAATDKDFLSDYQILIRRSLEFFEAQPSDMGNRQGRKKSVVSDQVGIRCRYCAHRSRHLRARGAVYFPGNLAHVYQSAQNMATHHLLTSCEDVPKELKEQLLVARKKQEQETRRAGGKQYWILSCKTMGLIERPGLHGLWFRRERSP